MTSSVDSIRKWKQPNIYGQLRGAVSVPITLQRPSIHLYESPYPLCTTPLSAFANRLYQDIFLKYHLQKGRDVQFIPQWQQYSSDIENEISQQLGRTNSNNNRLASEYQKVRPKIIRELVSVRQEELKNLGIFADWEQGEAVTNQRDHAKVITNFGRLVKADYVSQSRSLICWCCGCSTVRKENEQVVNENESISGHVCFPIHQGLEQFGVKVDLAVWVSELWQLVGCVAICVDPTEQYFSVQHSDRCLIIPQSLLNLDMFSIVPNGELLPVSVDEILASTCIHPISETNVEITESTKKQPDRISILVPGHVKIDYQLAQEKGLPVLCVLQEDGRLANSTSQINQLSIRAANTAILDNLNRQSANLNLKPNLVEKKHCQFCDQPTVYRPIKEWVWDWSEKDNNEQTLAKLSPVQWEKASEPSGLSPLPISNRHYGCIPIPIFRCRKCGQDICDTDALKLVRDLISRRGTDVWFSLGTEEMIPGNMSCPTCLHSIFKKEFNFFDGQFANLLLQQTRLQNLDKEKKIQLVYFYEKIRENNYNGLSKNQLFFQQLFKTGLATHKRSPLAEVLLLGQQCKSIALDFCPKLLLSQYSPDIVRLALLILLTSQDRMDLALKQAQADYHIVSKWLSAILSCQNSKALQKKNGPLLTVIDSAYEANDFSSVLRHIRHLANSSQKRFGPALVVSILQRIAPLMPFLAEQVYSDFKASTNNHTTLIADSIFLTHWFDVNENENSK